MTALPKAALYVGTGAANVILKEIQDDEGKGEWWTPRSDMHTIFEQARMKFVNGNLNYIDLRNMVIHANDKNPYWNPAFQSTRVVCGALRRKLNESGPLGRMCLWCVPPRAQIEPHTDNYEYHRMVSRWILFLTHSPENTTVLFDNQEQPSALGNIVRLQPFYQRHSFENRSDEPWYFFAFDTWDTAKLKKLVRPDDHLYEKSPQRIMYQSKH